MAVVNSVLGPLDTSDMGFTLTHEHIITGSAGFRYTYPEMVNRRRVEEVAVDLLIQARKEGVTTLVDCTPMDLDRDVSLIQAVSKASGVNIICATGSHLYIPHAFFQTMFEWMDPIPADRVADLWVREIEEGIEGTGIRAGIIKVATNDPIRPPEELMLRAAARTHLRTGVLITTHTPHTSHVGLEQIRILQEEGVDMSKVYVGHVNSTLDHDYHKRMMEKGVWLGMDHFSPSGPPTTPDWRARTAFIRDLIDDGYEDRIMLSHDWNVGGLASDDPLSSMGEGNPDGYLWISRGVLPYMRELGISDRAVDKLMIDNPRNFFEETGQ